MRQYELAIRIAQVHHLVDERKYKKALAVIQTIDMRQVRALSDLKVFAEVYTKTEQYDAAKATYLRIYRRSHTKRVLYRLIYLSIRTNALNDAEAYYQEFVRMNPNARDALILRYRLDKASGAPMGQLIDILQELKQEEYIEEWAYELAKLYHRAGRKEECKEECEDIILWFGTGEIVERARILIDHLGEEDSALYYDDKDFTVPRKEEPNPEDTGSLPDLNEFIKERKAHKREERREGRSAGGRHGEEDFPEEEQKKKKTTSEDDFVDDYEDDFAEGDMDLPKKAKDGIHKLSGLLKIGKKEEEEDSIPAEEYLARILRAENGENPERVAKLDKMEKAQSALHSERAANLEVPEKPDAMKKQEKIKKSQRPENAKKLEGAKKSDFSGEREKTDSQEEQKRVQKPDIVVKPRKTGGEDDVKIGFVPHSQSGMGITQDLAKEIAAIYEMEHKEQLKEKAVTVIHESSNLASNVVERMTQAVQKNVSKTYIPLDIEEIQPTEKVEEARRSIAGEEEQEKAQEPILGEEALEKPQEPIPGEEEQEKAQEAIPGEEELEKIQEAIPGEEELEKIQEAIAEEEMEKTQEPIAEEAEPYSPYFDQGGENTAVDAEEHVPQAFSEEEMRERALTKMLEEEVAEIQKSLTEEQIAETSRQDTETLKSLMEEKIKDPDPIENPVPFEGEAEEELLAEEASVSQEELLQEEIEEVSQEEPIQEEIEEVSQEEPIQEEMEEVSQEGLLQEEAEDVFQEPVSGLEGYRAPDIPVVETEYMEMPEITFDELPTTRALQQSFGNVLKLIAGELDPSHFVLMGDGSERIVGVSKQIVRVMKETGYLSQGRIAKIHAKQINKMDLISFRSQLRGNCLLIEEASDLLFPTITRLFSIMEEYYGDFVVILVDEGTTLDQLFRFVPALAKKFKYIIDISNYTREDYS